MKFLHLYVYEFLYERRGLNIELIAAVSQKDAEVIFNWNHRKVIKKIKIISIKNLYPVYLRKVPLK